MDMSEPVSESKMSGESEFLDRFTLVKSPILKTPESDLSDDSAAIEHLKGSTVKRRQTIYEVSYVF